MATIANDKWRITTDDAKVVIHSLGADYRLVCSRPSAWDLKDLLEMVLSIPERNT